MNKLFKFQQFRLISLCMVIMTVVLIVLHVTLFVTTQNIIVDQIGMSSQSVAVALSNYVMEDLGAYKQFLETKDVKSDYYRHMQEYFQKIKAASNIRYIYTERQVDGETVEFILDAEPIGSADYSAPGDVTFMDEASAAVYATGQPAQLRPVEHPDYGVLLGGNAPIFDLDGEILGLVGVNFDVSAIYEYLSILQWVMFSLYALILCLTFLFLLKYSNSLLEPVIKDKLTGAYSRRYFDKMLPKEMKASLKNQSDLALLMLDLDHFKNVNDKYGHGFGDLVLTATAKAIMGSLRKSDAFFRYGGEEFTAVIGAADQNTVQQIAERIRCHVAETVVYNEEMKQAVKITISIGIAYLGRELGTGGDLVENADKALYAAKVTRNCVATYREELFEIG